MNMAIYRVVRDDTGNVLINPKVFKCKDVLEGGGRRGHVRTYEAGQKREKGIDASEYLETLDHQQEHVRCGGKEHL